MQASTVSGASEAAPPTAGRRRNRSPSPRRRARPRRPDTRSSRERTRPPDTVPCASPGAGERSGSMRFPRPRGAGGDDAAANSPSGRPPGSSRRTTVPPGLSGIPPDDVASGALPGRRVDGAVNRRLALGLPSRLNLTVNSLLRRPTAVVFGRRALRVDSEPGGSAMTEDTAHRPMAEGACADEPVRRPPAGFRAGRWPAGPNARCIACGEFQAPGVAAARRVARGVEGCAIVLRPGRPGARLTADIRARGGEGGEGRTASGLRAQRHDLVSARLRSGSR